jgi:hypothetical protein
LLDHVSIKLVDSVHRQSRLHVQINGPHHSSASTLSLVSDPGQPDNLSAPQFEVFIPLLGSRIEKPHNLPDSRIDRGKIGSLVVVAFRTCISQVFANGLPAVFDSNDVIDLMGVRSVVLVNKAILATLSCPLNYQTTQ